MFKKLVAAIFLLSFVLLQFGAGYAEGTNELLNPGFEESNFEVKFWENRIYNQTQGAGEISVQSGQAHQGNNCIKITNNQANDSRIVQVVSVKPSTLYKLSGWIKTENVSQEGKGAILSVYMMTISTTELKGTNDWTYVELYGRTGPDQQALEFTAGLGGHSGESTGTAYFDDISVEEVTNVPDGVPIVNLYNPQQAPQDTNTQQADSKNWIIVLIAVLVAAIALIIFFVFKMSGKADDKKGSEVIEENHKGKAKVNPEPISNKKPFKIDRKDIIIMTAMTLIYSVIAIYNLGGTNVPETFWKPAGLGTTFTVNFDREYDFSKITYYAGIGDVTLRVEYLGGDGNFIPVATINQDVYKAFIWTTENIDFRAKTVRFKVQKIGGTMNEIVFFERGSDKPIKNFTVETGAANPKDMGVVQNLFDEQDFEVYTSNFMNSSYFDEIYHPRTAFENIYGMEPYETTHPPLGKLIIALGMLIFGVNPFGWRIMGTLFGVAMIPAMYLFGKKIFHKRIYGFISAFLIMFECMHFAQTRIGTIDSYACLFVILTYYFMYDFFINKSYETGFKKSLIPLLLSGIFWGLGCASKWTAVYAGGGLAVLYFTSKILEYRSYGSLLKRSKLTNTSRQNKLKAWLVNNFGLTSLACVLFFVAIPIIIYVSSYIPIITLPGDHHNLKEVWNYQVNMYDYHSKLEADHDFASPAWSWPLIKKPLLEYRDMSLPANKTSIMYVMGNPAIFWFGIVCVFAVLIISLLKKDKRAVPILVAFAFQYLPWFRVSRCIFIYHFFTSVPFLILSIVYVLSFLKEDFPKIVGRDFGSKGAEITAYRVSTSFIYVYLLIALAFFVLLYPAISGFVVPSSYLNWVRWLHVL
jgi:dolichyl-phosphate-mannose-protein mannosyltransferase